jgi:hypothetical protein
VPAEARIDDDRNGHAAQVPTSPRSRRRCPQALTASTEVKQGDDDSNTVPRAVVRTDPVAGRARLRIHVTVFVSRAPISSRCPTKNLTLNDTARCTQPLQVGDITAETKDRVKVRTLRRQNGRPRQQGQAELRGKAASTASWTRCAIAGCRR